MKARVLSFLLVMLTLSVAVSLVPQATATHLPATVVFEASSGSSVNSPVCAGSATLTFSHTISNSPDRLLLVSVAFFQGLTVTSVTYAGFAMTIVRTDTNAVSGVETVSTYYMLDPPTGAGNVVVTLSGASTILLAISASYSNVLQAGPFGDTAGASYTNVLSAHTDMDVSSTSLVSEMPVGFAFGSDNSATPNAAVSADSGQSVDVLVTRDACVTDEEFRNGVFSITGSSGARAGNWDLDTDPAIPSNSGTVQMINLVPSRASDGDGGDGGPLPTFPPPLPVPVFCSDQGAAGLNITVLDTRPEAANAVLWIWNWGDGDQTIIASKSASHTYLAKGVYTITLRVTDTSGRIDSFAGTINLTGPGCNVLAAAYFLGPYVLASLILVAFTLFLQTLFGKRKWLRIPLAAAVVILAIVIVVFVYYGWVLELPGHFRFY
jgi:PKD repeat protein